MQSLHLLVVEDSAAIRDLLTQIMSLASGSPIADKSAEPANIGPATAEMELARAELLPKFPARRCCPKPVVTRPQVPATQKTTPKPAACSPQQVEVLVIGVSTGGPKALSAILKELPSDFPVPIVIVQHMPRIFTRHLAARLDKQIALKVVEASSGMTLLPGHVFIAPGDFHLELYRHGTAFKTALLQGPHENYYRPAVDVLFRSAAKQFGSGCLALVLTGMGQDGLNGAQHIVQAGGKVLAQDEATSVVWGMPRAVVEAGLADSVLPLHSITSELLRRVVYAPQTALTAERIL